MSMADSDTEVEKGLKSDEGVISPLESGDQAAEPGTAIEKNIKLDEANLHSKEATAAPGPETHDEKVDPTKEPPSEQAAQSDEGYSAFTVQQKRMIIIAASFSSFFSPLSSAIYFPALDTIANALGVTNNQVNLTVTTYLIIQGVAPTFIAGFSDTGGRRPAYIICFVIYFFANLGLSLQNSYVALLILRMVQSGGSSGTVALANGVVGDMVTSQDRGMYIAFASVGALLGPSISPIIGGLLTQYLDWHWVFWFLLILTGVYCVPLFLFMPETCRKVVGNGTIPPPLLNNNFTDMMRHRRRQAKGLKPDPVMEAEVRQNYKLTFGNPWSSLSVLLDLEALLLLVAAGLSITSFYAISTGAALQFSTIYGFNNIQIALVFIPIGIGGLISALSTGKIVDWNFRRHAKLNNFPVERNKYRDLSNFPVETARLQIALPMFMLGAASVLIYGWTMEHKYSLACPVILLFVMGYSLIAAFQTMSVLLVDIYPGRAASVTAASNFVRCELGAAGSAAIGPMMERIGAGWSYTILALLPVIFSPALLACMKYGIRWRKQKKEKTEQKKKREEEKRSSTRNDEERK